MNKGPMLRGWIGKEIQLAAHGLYDENVLVKLIGIEPATGIWIEDHETVNNVLKKRKIQTLDSAPIIFIPFSRIDSIIVSGDCPALNEHAFGIYGKPPKDSK